MHSAASIADAYRTGKVSFKALCRQYRCNYNILRAAILSQMSADEYRWIVKQRRVRAGKSSGWQKGHVPWDKGKKGIHLSPATEFKKGCFRGAAVRRWRPVGTIKARHDKPSRSVRLKHGPKVKGNRRRWIKVRDDGPQTRRWIPYARYLWQKRNGPVPDGMFVVHANGNTMDDRPANLIISDLRRNMSRNCHRRPEIVALARKRGADSKRRNTAARRAIAALASPHRPAWHCPTCGATYDTRPTRCTKCSSYSLEPISLSRSG
ncbi:MAG: HNH endonuclease [Sedimentisphaerales bacterium]|nr:HNH endonuclease [Sedimentisphaerales bacterium]